MSGKKSSPSGLRIYAEFEDMAGHKIRVQESCSVYGGIWVSNDSKEVSTNLSVENARTLIQSLEDAIEHQEKSKRIWRRRQKRERV